MGDRAMLAKATRELEELYIGIPDESVDLTFAHLVTQKNQNGVAERKVPSIQPIQEENIKEGLSSKTGSRTSKLPRPYVGAQDEKDRKAPDVSSEKAGLRNIMGSSFVYDDFSGMNVIGRSSLQDGEGRRRPGIPHSNICTICSSYVHVFRHRCLVCGRVYCRQCVCAGMGEMTEGRKCVECLGARFSQRYIQNAGEIGCWCSRYSSRITKQEIKWAEKGPRRSRGSRREYRSSSKNISNSRSPRNAPRTPTKAHIDSSTIMSRSPIRAPITATRAYVNSSISMSGSRSPISAPRTPTMGHISSSISHSFVMSSPYRTYSPTNHHNPF